jgi:hypothetical protein
MDADERDLVYWLRSRGGVNLDMLARWHGTTRTEIVSCLPLREFLEAWDELPPEERAQLVGTLLRKRDEIRPKSLPYVHAGAIGARQSLSPIALNVRKLNRSQRVRPRSLAPQNRVPGLSRIRERVRLTPGKGEHGMGPTYLGT